MVTIERPHVNREWRWRRWDQNWVPLLEGGLILLMGGITLALQRPLLFASLGPTAYEQIEKPESPSAKLYNVIVGHWIGMASGFAALALLNAWNVPKPTIGHFTAARVEACTIAVALTALCTLLAKAGQPAAYATAIMVAEGSMQRASDAWAIALAVIILGLVGEPIRRMRLLPGQPANQQPTESGPYTS
ncbi:MAG TPA: HPP family protein [Terriglobales bacterium]